MCQATKAIWHNGKVRKGEGGNVREEWGEGCGWNIRLSVGSECHGEMI